MKKFQFRLEKLLDIRRYKEKLVENELAKAERKKYILIEKKEGYLNEYEESKLKMRKDEKKKVLTIERMQFYQRFFKRLKSSASSQNKLIMIADEEMKLIHNKLVEARKQKMILERLKEKKLSKYMYELQKEEQNFFDEVGNTSFIHKKRVKDDDLSGGQKVKEKKQVPIKYKEYEKNLTEQIYEEIMKEGEY